MRLLRRVYLGISFIITLGGYALVFGDVGYFKRKEMKKEIANLENKISLLKSENRYLTEQYELLKNKSHKKAAILSRGAKITIIQFKKEKIKKQGFASFFSREHDSIQEARILFLGLMFLLISFGYLFLRHFSKDKKEKEGKVIAAQKDSA